MTNLLPGSNKPQSNWKTQVYAIGAGIGALFGIISAYMYSRATEEDVSRTGKAARVQTGDLLGLGLAALAMVRQITEMGKGPDKGRKK